MQWLSKFLLSALMIMPVSAHAAPDVSALFTRTTGVAPFDADNTPGNDSGPDNTIIRTNDTINYSFEVAVRDDDVTNLTMRLNVSAGLQVTLPAFCLESGVSPVSSISGSETTGFDIICNVGNIREGSQVIYALPATVIPEQANGSTVSLSGATIESDQTPLESFSGFSDTVSAEPRLDLIKDGHTRLIGVRPGPSGESGVLYAFSLLVATQNNGIGSELVTAPLTFTDDLAGVAPNALLFQGWPGAFSNACVPNDTRGFPLLWRNPIGNTQVSDGGPGGDRAGPAIQSVFNSGTLSCTGSTPGGTASVTITGADLSGRHFPLQAATRRALPSDTRFLVSGVMFIWIPVSDINAGGGEITVNNIYSALNATSISGQPNAEPDLTNNRRRFIARDGSNGRFFHNTIDHTTFALIPGQTARRSGDGIILPGQTFATRHYQTNGTVITKQTLDDISLCTSFDNNVQTITEITPGQGARMQFEGTPEGVQPDFTIEYGTGTFGRDQTCDDGDSPTGWYTDINLVPGGPSAISKVRATAPYLAAPGGSSSTYRANLMVQYTAADDIVGAIVPQWGTFRYNQLNGGRWFLSTYDETTALGILGDRLFLTNASARIDKDTNPPGDEEVLAGDTLGFRLTPSLTAPAGTPAIRTDVTVTDTLPEAYRFILGSASPPVSNFTDNADGTTTLVWEFPSSLINSPLPVIDYDVTVAQTTPDRTEAINSVVISSPGDGSVESLRTDTHSILVINPAGFSVFKIASPVLVSPDNIFSYRLIYANTGTTDYGSVQFIDVLPSMRVPQTPPTNFDGASAFDSVSGTNGEVFEYTRTDPATINSDPADASNQPGGSTVWCSSFSGGSCPASPAEVTAVRGTSPPFLRGQPQRVVTVNINGTANDSFNTYSNRFTARAEGLAFAVTSTTATVSVRTADISLEKTVAPPTAANPDIVTFTLTASNNGPHSALNADVTDTLPSGLRYFDHSGAGTFNPSTGIWKTGDVPVGGSRSLTLRAEVLPGGNYTNIAEVTAQLYADPDSSPANMATAPGEDDESSASLTRLSGLIFLDTGAGGGTAHDGVVNGTEAGGRFGTIALRSTATGTIQSVAKVGADGTWSAVLTDGLPSQFEAVFVPSTSFILMSEGGTGLPSLVNPVPNDGNIRFTPDIGFEYTGLNFGVIREPLLQQDQVSSIAAGQITDLSHRYEAPSSGSVLFSLANLISNPEGAFSNTLLLDADCDDVPERPFSGALPILPDQSICIIVRTQAGGGVSTGASHIYDLIALTSFAGSTITHTTQNSDRLDLNGSGNDQLVLRKLVKNITAGTPETTNNTGDIGDVLEYRLILTNPGAGPAMNVIVRDQTPAWTALSTALASSTNLTPTVVCNLVQPDAVSNAPGYVGPLNWSCPGSVPPGSGGVISFRVSIAP